MALETGIKGRAECTVSEKDTAKALRSGGLDVLATPIMIALMEESALTSVRPYLEEGTDTVGTNINVSHLSATPVGLRAWAESELVEIDRRRLVFNVKAYDEKGLIGEGTHERQAGKVNPLRPPPRPPRGGFLSAVRPPPHSVDMLARRGPALQKFFVLPSLFFSFLLL